MMRVTHAGFSTRRIGLLTLCLFTFFQAQAFANEWHDLYLKSQKAANAQKWRISMLMLQKAIEQHPQPEKDYNIPGRNRTIQYLPYLALARALRAVGNDLAAYHACEESQRRGIAPAPLLDRCFEETRQAVDSPETGTEKQQPASTSAHALDSTPSEKRQLRIEPGTKIAILNFQGLMVEEELGTAAAEIFRTEIVGLGDYTVIERAMVEEVLKEQELQLSGAVDSETAVEIGNLIGAQAVVLGSLVKTGNVYTINARLIDVATGIVKIGENMSGEGENSIPTLVHQLVKSMLYQIP